jgi:hypothetical protein
MSMPRYLVTWGIDFEEDDAKSPEEAARMAQSILLDPNSLPPVFEVEDCYDNMTYIVELDPSGPIVTVSMD